MPTIYDEIKSQFKLKLNDDKFQKIIDSEKLDENIFDLSIDILVNQIKNLRKNNFEETKNIVGSDANELVRSIDQETQKLNEIN